MPRVTNICTTSGPPATTSGGNGRFAGDVPPDFHNIGGTATVLDINTLSIDDFTFDRGIEVFFYLGVEDSHPDQPDFGNLPGTG